MRDADRKARSDLASAKREMDAAENPSAVARLAWDAVHSALMAHLQDSAHRAVRSKSHHVALVIYAERHLREIGVLTERQVAEVKQLHDRRTDAAYPHHSATAQPVGTQEAAGLYRAANSITTKVLNALPSKRKPIPPPPPR